jgi:hypothetical protein
MELVKNTNVINAVIYESRISAQPYISDKHIDGVKKWESIEKSSYFYHMYQEEIKTDPSISPNSVVNQIARLTVSNKPEVRDCIIKYGFFMRVYNALKETYSPDALTETNSYLPLVDRFMKLIVGNTECGLGIALSTRLEYLPHPGKEALYKKILKLIGEAFLVRKTESNCEAGELPRINSKEIYTNAQQKKLVKDNVRIPGLFALIKQYKEIPGITIGTGNIPANGADVVPPTATSSPPDDVPNRGGSNIGKPDSPLYEPAIPWTPKKPQTKSLSFSSVEGLSFNLSDNNDEDAKIKFVIRELSHLYVSAYPYACTLLYRTLLESATRKAYREKQPREKGMELKYNDNDLAGQLLKLANNNILGLSAAVRGAVKSKIGQENLVKVLNDCIHNPKMVDSDFILTSWVTMKEYVKACLT